MKKKRTPSKTSTRGLTPKQKLFVSEYLTDMNATQAYLRAGYRVSESVAAVNALNTLRNPKISEAINEALGRRLAKLEISNDVVLQEIAKSAFANMMDYITIRQDGTAVVDFSQLTRDQAAAIAEIHYDDTGEKNDDGEKTVRRFKFKLFSKMSSLEMLGKYLKLFSDTTPATALSPKVQGILRDVLDDVITVKEAAYRITMMGYPIPEVLKIELSKMAPDMPPLELPPAISDEELERRYQDELERLDKEEREWRPVRQTEIKALKDELRHADAWAGPTPDMAKKFNERS